MKNRLHFIPLFLVAIAALIVGSFLDLSISQALYIGKDNWFTVVFAILGSIALCGCVTFLSIVLILRYSLAKEKIWKFIMCFVGVCGVAFCCYYFGDTMASSNVLGVVIPQETWAKVLTIVLSDIVLVVGCFLAAWFTRNKITDVKFLQSAAFLVVIAGVGVLGFYILKVCMPRLRYRTITELTQGVENFTQWWSPIKNKEFYIDILGIDKEEIRSFPSGHTLCSCYSIIAVPFIIRMYKGSEKVCIISLYSLFVFTLITGLSRMCGGAHFLSDTAFGTILMLCILLIYNQIELYIRFPKPKEVTVEK